MKVAVSSTGKDLDSQIDPRFGRCAYFLIIETDDMRFEAFDNASIALGGGAGIQSAQFVASKGAKAVITGNCGPNAVRTLSAAGVAVFVGQTGTIRDALNRYKNGELQSTTEANVSDHYGMGGGGPAANPPRQAFGGGMGRGMGGGRGMGCGRELYQWRGPSETDSPGPSYGDELRFLKEQAAELSKQMEEIQNRIKRLEKA